MSAFYAGSVFHRRFRPKEHTLRYGVFSLLIDLDEIPELAKRLRLLRFDRRGLYSFQAKDHGAGETALRPWVERHLADAGLPITGGRIQLLTYPRLLGYVFNPLSVFFCYDRSEQLEAILYEVANTYGERHTYVIAVDGAGDVVQQTAQKVFYVSPFLPVAGRYGFAITPPGEKVGITITLSDADGVLLTASFQGRRRPLSDSTLAAAFFRYPLMTLKVMAGIHWEALKLWRKGIRFNAHRPAARIFDRSVEPRPILVESRAPAPPINRSRD